MGHCKILQKLLFYRTYEQFSTFLEMENKKKKETFKVIVVVVIVETVQNLPSQASNISVMK